MLFQNEISEINFNIYTLKQLTIINQTQKTIFKNLNKKEKKKIIEII
jgi:hypothetical protein